MRLASVGLFLVGSLLSGCATTAPVAPVQFYKAEAVPTRTVRVLPVLHVYDTPQLRLDGYLNKTVPWMRELVRRERMGQIGKMPQAVASSLPGAIHAALQGRWDGDFRVGSYPVGGRDRISSALHGRADLDTVLAEVARGGQDDGVLVTWVTALDGDPLTAEAFPGEIVETANGPVVVDTKVEPYRVRARVGMALVHTNGEVVVRYEDDFEAVLSGEDDFERAGRVLASDLASQVGPLWPSDVRLLVGEPQDRPARTGRNGSTFAPAGQGISLK